MSVIGNPTPIHTSIPHSNLANATVLYDELLETLERNNNTDKRNAADTYLTIAKVQCLVSIDQTLKDIHAAICSLG